MSNSNAIKLTDLEYKLGDFSLGQLTTNITKGKITTIIGPNGSGKSTLLKLISQLIPCNCGEICINDTSISCFKKKELAQNLAMLPQSKEQLPDVTIKELVTYGRSPYKTLFKQKLDPIDWEAINWAMEVTGTKKFENRNFYSLSGGQQQKARIAMALAQKTDILLLDEPTTYLDLAHQIDLMELLTKINKEFQITIVMVLHDLQQAAAFSDNLIAMKDGSIIGTGTPMKLLNETFLNEIFNLNCTIRFEDNYPFIIPKNFKLSKENV